MKRELLFSLAGFLAGFVVAFAVFWQPARERAESAAGATAAHVAGERSGGTTESGRRPIVVRAAGEGHGATTDEQALAPKSPAELMHELLASLPDLKPEQRQPAVNDLLAKLRQMGPAGLQVVRDFLRGGEDVKFQNGYAMVNGKLTMSPSLRVALLNALGDWPGADATELTRDVLRSTSQLAEAAMAIRQLEAKVPGAYRADAIQALIRASAS